MSDFVEFYDIMAEQLAGTIQTGDRLPPYMIIYQEFSCSILKGLHPMAHDLLFKEQNLN